jgi:hypothetical protein
MLPFTFKFSMPVAVFPEKITVAACALETPSRSKVPTIAIVSLTEFFFVFIIYLLSFCLDQRFTLIRFEFPRS